jgi:putative Ig domain-containing protein
MRRANLFVYLLLFAAMLEAESIWKRIVQAVGGGPPVIVTISLPMGETNAPYSAPLQATGGKPPYRWTAGLPSGLAVSGSSITGQSSVIAQGSVPITVIDARQKSASATLLLAICDPLRVEPQSVTLQPGESVQFTAYGGPASLDPPVCVQ